MRTRLATFGAALLALCVTSTAAQSRIWRAEERVLITSFAEVGALAADQRRLFVATRGGLAIFDQQRGQWELPSTRDDEYPADEQPSALAYDPLQMEVWLGTMNGGLYRLSATTSRWETVAFALGQVNAIVPSSGIEEDGIWVQTNDAWHRVGRLALGASRVTPDRVPPTVLRRADAQRSIDPSLSAFRATLGMDPQGRRWQLTGFARGERAEQLWFGTNGNFVFSFDAARATPQWFWYGAPTRGVSAIAMHADTLWLGADGRGPRAGVVRGTRDLQRWQLLDARNGAPNARVDQIAITESHIYFAAQDGVSSLDRQSGRWQQLSSTGASSVATAGNVVFAATRSGLLHVSAGASRVIPGPTIQRVRVFADTVWIATANGLFHALAATTPDSIRLMQVPGLPAARFSDVARSGDRLFAISEDALFVRDSTGWSPPIRSAQLSSLRRLNCLTADGSAIWIGGAMGIARYQLAPEQWLLFQAPDDLPAGAVQHIVPDGDYVWLATPAGALRLQWKR